MQLENFLKKENVIILKNNEKQLVIREMLQQLESNGQIESSGKYYTQVIHRESLETTGIGKGFAIPHARTDSVKDFISIFGVSKGGIDYQSIDNEPVKYLLLSIFHTDMSTQYLYFIGMMARMFSKDENIKKLNKARTADEIYKQIEENFKIHFEQIVDTKKNESVHADSLKDTSLTDLDLLIRLHRFYHLYDEGNKSESMNTKIIQLKKLISNKSLTYYERMRKKCKDPFTVVEKNNCSGCFLEIPAANIELIKEEKKISVCPHCGRFLILL